MTSPNVETLQFKPPLSLFPFFASDKFITLQLGPYGSTKTSAGIMKIAYHAKRMMPCRDGVRRSRCVWVRNTMDMLKDTSIPDFLHWFPDGVAGHYEKTRKVFTLKFDDVECEVMFRGLDDPRDVRRVLALQLSFAIFDEFREINPDVFSNMQGRLGRYPNKTMVPPVEGVHEGGCIYEDGSLAKRLWGMSNPPDYDTYWEQYFNDPPSNAACYIQPSGMSPEADWRQYLDSDYYENLIESHQKDQDWIDVYVHAKFGASLAGKAVFRSFVMDYHVAKEAIEPLVSENHPLIIGMDFGLTPACTINQQDPRGRFMTLDELTSEGMGILRFCREMLKPLLTNRFPGYPVVIIGDPAGSQRAQTDEKSVFDVLRAEGFTVIPAKTNSIQARIAAVEALLSGQVDTGARHLIDPRCRKLIKAMRSGYRFKLKKSGELEDTPEKNFYSHIADAHQYAALHVDQTFGGTYETQSAARTVKRVKFRAWT